MKKSLLAVVAATALTLTACNTAPVAGTVVEKEIELRKKSQPSRGVKCYELDIKDADGDVREICVLNKTVWDKYEVGDQYP